jgi:hypothetical protein
MPYSAAQLQKTGPFQETVSRLPGTSFSPFERDFAATSGQVWKVLNYVYNFEFFARFIFVYVAA